jgi:WD40 repeat protein/serine/threonine protein kinase
MSGDRSELPAEVDGEEAVLADWVADLVERLEAGEPVDLGALAMSHPERADELGRVLPTIRRMVSFGRAVARSPGGERPVNPPGLEAELGTLGDFRLLREVGRGGMGIVYEAEQVSLQRRVALKILPLAAALDPRQHQRFLLEARAAACLHHTHIVPVYAVGSERGVPYYAMQFIEGFTLAQALRDLRGRDADRLDPHDSHATPVPSGSTNPSWSPVPAEAGPDQPATGSASSLGRSSRDRAYIRAVAELGRRAAEALDHAHGRGILHRDIKPANLMLDVAGHLWVTDFGLAQIQGDSRLTLTGDILGTLRYMSPEQALGKRVVIDGRTDLYSLGATLYELLALRPVFDGADRAEVLRKIAQDEPTPLRRLNPAVPRDLETIVHKALCKEPSDRYATAWELADDLGRFLDARPIAARPPGQWERLGKWARRNRAVVAPASAFAMVGGVAIVGGLVWSNLWMNRHSEQLRIERDRAKQLSGLLRDQRDLAEDRRRVADHHLYAFRLRQAAEALRARRFEKAQEILRDCRPEPGEDDPREFAWHYLWRESSSDVAVLSERTESVTSLAVSPDGRTLAIGDRDGTVRLRDPETGQVTMALRDHAFRVESLAFSTGGRRLVSCGGRTTPTSRAEALLWDLGSGRLLARLDGLENIDQVVFDEGGDHFWLLYRALGHMRLGCWDVKTDPSHPRLTWSRPHELARPPRAGDGPIAAIESGGPGYRLRDLIEAMNLGWTGTIYSDHGQVVATSPDGRLLAVGAGPWNVLWDVKADRERARYPNRPEHGLLSIGFSPDNRYVVVESNGIDRCEVYDLGTGAVRTIPPAVVDPGLSRPHAFSPDGRLFARSVWKQGSPPRTKIWQLDPWREVATYPGVPGNVDSLVFARDGQSLIVHVNPAAVRWDFRPPPEPSQPGGHRDEAWAVAFSTDGRFLATGSDDTDDLQTLKLWDAATGRLLRGWKPHEATTSAVAFQPGGHILASAGLKSERNLRLWDADTGRLLATLDGHTDKVRTVAFSPDGRLLATAGDDRVIRLWDVASRRPVRSLSGHADKVRQVAFSPSGRTLASVGNDPIVRLWSTDTGEALQTWPGSAKIASVVFSPDGGVVSWAQEDGIIQRRDLARGELLAPLHSEYEELRCLAFSPDGRTLAAAGKSGSIHLWDPVSGQELLTLEGRPCQTNALAFSPDGSSLAACWHDGTVWIVRAR